MADCITYMLVIFQSWLGFIFNDFTFQYAGFNVSFGWLILAALMISIIIGSILNIPSRLPGYSFISQREHYRRDVKHYQRRRYIAGRYNAGWRIR